MAKDRYKEKKCPICGILHKKKRQCCSVQCGLEFRSKTPVADHIKKKISEGIKRWKQTPAGEATNSNLNVMDEDNMILPPFESNDYYLEDGDIWSPT